MPEPLWVQSEKSTVFLIEKYAKPGDLILDVGVGLGRILSHFPNLRKYGMDISFGYLEEAKRKEIDVCFARIEDMPYQEQTFDIVVCTDVLEHVFDLNFCVAKILSVLKDKGTLIVRVPFQEVLKGYTEADYPYQFVHLRSFDEHSLRLFFEKIFGCRMVEGHRAGYFLCGDDRIRDRELFNADEYNALMKWISKLEKISPSLYWDILRKLHLPSEFNAVIQKSEITKPGFPCLDSHRLRGVVRENGSPETDNALRPPCAAMIQATQSFQSRLMDDVQKIAYLEAKLAEAQAGFSLAEERDRLVSERDDLLVRIEKLSEERDRLVSERDGLLLRIEKLSEERERLNLVLDRISEERSTLLAELEQVKRKLGLGLKSALIFAGVVALFLLAKLIF
jgi:SAM-dependent methyltransferase